MAGLQQYNFFPTDLFYPRPPPSLPPAAVVPVKPPKQETCTDLHLQSQPRGVVSVPPSNSSALVISHKAKSPVQVDKKLSPPWTDPLSLLSWVADEEGSDA
ncbi:hypothetical protein K1719_007920 [Acacia pycnantha]|nr:hypothetical protein K1719_007920 [Acacia pycnantha]